MTAKEFVEKFPNTALKDEESFLHDMACPNCGGRRKFFISFSGTCVLNDHGSSDDGDHEWEDSSSCRCADCDHGATVKEFTIEGLDEQLEEANCEQ